MLSFALASAAALASNSDYLPTQAGNYSCLASVSQNDSSEPKVEKFVVDKANAKPPRGAIAELKVEDYLFSASANKLELNGQATEFLNLTGGRLSKGVVGLNPNISVVVPWGTPILLGHLIDNGKSIVVGCRLQN